MLNPYRFGFNGKEKDNEINGNRNSYDYGFRIYNPRLGKFLSVDPLSSSYPWNSTYAFAENDVIRCVDLDGAERDYSFVYLDKSGTFLKATNHYVANPTNGLYGQQITYLQEGKDPIIQYVPSPDYICFKNMSRGRIKSNVTGGYAERGTFALAMHRIIRNLSSADSSQIQNK